MAKAAHHRGTHQANARKLVTAGNATPGAVCWRCGLTLHQHAPHKNGRRARWTAGHTIDGSLTAAMWENITFRPPPGDWLALEASTCNFSAGAALSSADPTPRIVTTRQW